MSATTLPKLYLIQSKIDDSDWVVTVKTDANGNPFPRINRYYYDVMQYWAKEDVADARGGFRLKNPFDNLYLLAGSSQGGHVEMRALDTHNDEMIWRKENDDDWGCLNKHTDWEQKMQLSGDGPYNEDTAIIQYEYDRGSAHELWKLVEYTPDFGPTDVVYNEQAKTLILGDPIAAVVVPVTNQSTSAAFGTTLTLQTTHQKTMSHAVTDQTQRTLTTVSTFGAKFSVEKVFEVSEQGSVTASKTTSRTINDQSGTSDTITVTAAVTVSVPPGKSYQVSLMARHCSLTVPYTATITRSTPGRAGVPYQISGVYRFESAYRYDILVADAAAGTPVANAVTKADIIAS